jgi:preprotein translocase subunit Sss1
MLVQSLEQLGSSSFRLSPGITPQIVDTTILGFIMSFGLAVALAPKKVAGFILGGDTIILAAFKLWTDYSDFRDAATALAGFTSAALLIIANASKPLNKNWSTALLVSLIGLVAFGTISLSVLKAISDFYDPFDLTLSCSSLVCVVFLLNTFVRLAVVKHRSSTDSALTTRNQHGEQPADTQRARGL